MKIELGDRLTNQMLAHQVKIGRIVFDKWIFHLSKQVLIQGTHKHTILAVMLEPYTYTNFEVFNLSLTDDQSLIGLFLHRLASYLIFRVDTNSTEEHLSLPP